METSDRDEIWMCMGGAGVLDLLMVHMVLVYGSISQGRPSFSRHILYDIGDVSRVKFWQDHWCGETSLAVSYPDLFRFCRNKKASVVELMKSSNGVLFWDVSFFRGVHARELEALSGFNGNHI